MGIFYQPPPPFMGGSQPHAPRELTPSLEDVPANDPPFIYGGPVVDLQQIAYQTQPDPWVYVFFGGWQPFQPGRLNVTTIAVVGNNPPFTYGGPLIGIQELAYLAQPDPWVYTFKGTAHGRQPYGQNQLNPSITAVAVNNPPFTYGGPVLTLQETAYLSQPDPWVYILLGNVFGGQPYGPRRLAADQIGNPVNNPPFTYGGPNLSKQEIAYLAQPDPWTYTFMGAWQPFDPRNLAPALSAVAANNPPFAQRRAINDMSAILTGWALAPPPDVDFRLRPPYKVALTLGYSRGYIIT
jgi:hypothetical protein